MITEMTTAIVNISVTTEAQIRVFVDLEEIELGSAGKGEVNVPINEEELLSWIIIGNPGEEYQIELTPNNSAYKVTAVSGKHPIKSSISTRLFRASGHIRFEIEKK